MSKVLIKDPSKAYLQPIIEFEHHSKIVSNTAYATNMLYKALSRGQTTIELDKTKLTRKVNTGTICNLFDRDGQPITILDYIKYKSDRQIDLTDPDNYNVVIGESHPQHGDRFSRLEGRKYALSNAISNMKLVSIDPGFNQLLKTKQFLETYELNNGATPVSYQFMDFWYALKTNNSDSIKQTSIKLVGLDDYNTWFNEWLQMILEEIDSFNLSNKSGDVERYTLIKAAIKSINNRYF